MTNILVKIVKIMKGVDTFNFSIISPILVELLRCTIPHFKAL